MAELDAANHPPPAPLTQSQLSIQVADMNQLSQSIDAAS